MHWLLTLGLGLALATAPLAAPSSALADTPPAAGEAERELRTPPDFDNPAADNPPPGFDAPKEVERRYLTDEDFRTAFEGKTVHLSANGEYYGSEQYFPGDRTLWIFRAGRCQEGRWVYARQVFCFFYPNSDQPGPSCWRVFESGEEYFAESVDGLLLKIYAVEERPLTCEPELFTQLRR